MIVGYGSVKWFQWLTLVMDGASFCHHKQYIWGPLRIHSDMNGIIFFLFYILYIFCPSNLTFTGGGCSRDGEAHLKRLFSILKKGISMICQHQSQCHEQDPTPRWFQMFQWSTALVREPRWHRAGSASQHQDKNVFKLLFFVGRH